MAFSPDGKTLATGDNNGSTYLWNVAAAASASSSAAGTGWIRLGNLTTSPVDVYVYSPGNSSPQIVLSDLTYGTVSSYQVANAGDYTVKMRSAGSSASSKPAFTASVTVQAGRAYTVAALTVATGGGQATVLDDSLTTPAGKSLVRVIQASLTQKKVKFYCSCGGFITTNAAPGSVSADAPIPPGTWTMTATGSSAKGSLPVTLTAATVHTELVLDTAGGGIQIVNLTDTAGPGNAKLIAALPDPGTKGVISVAFSPDGRTLAAGDANGKAYVWDVTTAKPITTLTDPDGKTVYSVAFSPDGKTLATGDTNGSTYLWNVAAAASASSSAAGTGWIRLGNLTTSPVDVYVYSPGNSSPQIVLSDLTYGTVSSYQVANAGDYTVKMRSAGSSASSKPAFTASVTVQAGRAYTVAALTVATGGGQATVLDDSLTTPAGKSLVRVIQASLTQKKVKFYCSCGGFITTNAAPGSVSADAPIPPGTWTMTATGSSAKGSLPVTLTAATVHTELVLDTAGGGIQIVNLTDTAGPGNAKLIAALPDPGTKGVISVAFSPDGRTLAAGDANGKAYVWDVTTAKPITTLTDPGSAGINSVAFSPDGKTLAIGDESNSGRVYLWHIRSHLSVVGVNARLLDRHVTQFVSGRARERPDEIFRAADADGSDAGERRAFADHVGAADSVPSVAAAAMPVVE